MRLLNSIETERLRLLTEKSVALTLIEPTETGLKKSIMDATGTVRTYLFENSLHNYSIQKQGQDNKIQIQSFLVANDSLIKSVASLYRPNTKNGDPRIWFKGLGEYSRANDILGLIAYEKSLYVINLSRLDIAALFTSVTSNPVKELINEISSNSNSIANELLYKLKKIAKMGAIPALLSADTAVGRTLEKMLGIKINSCKQPDYKGIELKSYRDKRANRKSLFAQVPNWELSKLKSSSEILDTFGYWRDNIFRLYCTVSAKNRNPQSLILKLESDLSRLIENSDKPGVGDFAVWNILSLHNRLLEKHNETFWVAAESKIIDEIEHFIYTKVEHTKKPIVSQFDVLLEQGIITLDHAIKRSLSGKVTEKGPFFKLRKNALGLLFPPSQIYSLITK